MQRRVAESTPNRTAGDCNDKCLSDPYPAEFDKLTSRTNGRNRSLRSNSHAQSNESKRKTLAIMGDSMISYQDEKLHSNRRRTVKVRSYPGTTSEDLTLFRLGGGGGASFTIHSNPGCCHGNTFVKSGSTVKNDQNQETLLKIKTAAIFD